MTGQDPICGLADVKDGLDSWFVTVLTGWGTAFNVREGVTMRDADARLTTCDVAMFSFCAVRSTETQLARIGPVAESTDWPRVKQVRIAQASEHSCFKLAKRGLRHAWHKRCGNEYGRTDDTDDCDDGRPTMRTR